MELVLPEEHLSGHKILQGVWKWQFGCDLGYVAVRDDSLLYALATDVFESLWRADLGAVPLRELRPRLLQHVLGDPWSLVEQPLSQVHHVGTTREQDQNDWQLMT